MGRRSEGARRVAARAGAQRRRGSPGLRTVQPGEMRRFERDADAELRVGTRLAVVVLPRLDGRGTDIVGYRVDPRGPWEVAGVEPVRGHAGRVRVHIEAL